LKIVRSIFSVLGGFLLTLALLRLLPLVSGGADVPGEPLGFQFMTLFWTVGAAIAGGYLAALIADSHEYPHAATVGFLLIVASIISMRQQALARPGWYEITVGGCGPISAMIGCALRILTRRRA